MKKISRKGFLKVAAAAAMSGVTASALAACNAGSSSSTAASTGEAIYTPGTYTGTATGIGEVKVTMTFSETAITDVVIDASNETESIGGVAAPTLKDALMAAQSTEIDNISGATITTNAVKKAAASCIEQAMGVHTAGGDTAASSSDEDWLGTEPEIDESKVAKTVDVDVAVVGCGIAGVAACRSVAEDGGLVAAFEKADGPQCRSGEYAVINGKVQAKWGRDTWTREQIDDIIDSHMVESTYRCKRSIMSKWAHNIGDDLRLVGGGKPRPVLRRDHPQRYSRRERGQLHHPHLLPAARALRLEAGALPLLPHFRRVQARPARHRRGQYAESHRHRQCPDLLRLLR